MGAGQSLWGAFADSVESQAGKTIVITGCTSGTGLVLAKLSVSKGANVVMLNRKSERANSALEQVKAEAAEGTSVSFIECDLMDFESVKKASTEIKASFPEGLDVLVNNAGIMAFPDEASKHGYDIQMQVNHLSHFLLTKELYPLLEKKANESGEARIVNHSSIARLGTPLDVKYLEKNGGNLGGNDVDVTTFSGPRIERYHQTKLANAVFTTALADRLKSSGSKVKVMVAHPGVSATNLGLNMTNTGVAMNWFQSFVFENFLCQTQEDGTLGIGRCTFDKDANNGDFYGPVGGRNARKGEAVKLDLEDICTSDEAKDMLWSASEEACGCKFDL